MTVFHGLSLERGSQLLSLAKKMMYGKQVEGTIRSSVIIGPKGDILKHWPALKKAADQPQEVLDFLAGEGRPPA